MATGDLIHKFLEHNNNETYGTTVTAVAFSPTEKKAASGDRGGWFIIWESDTGNILYKFTNEHTDDIQDIEFFPDGNKIITVSNDNTVKIWDVNTGEIIVNFTSHTVYVYGVGISGDGNRVITASSDGAVKIWDPNDGSIITNLSHNDYAEDCDLNLDGTIAVSCGSDLARVWEVSTGNIIKEFNAHTDYITSIDFDPKDLYIASGSNDQTVKVWEYDTGNIIVDFLEHIDDVRSVKFSGDGSFIGSSAAYDDQTLKIFNLNGDIVLNITISDNSINSIDFNIKYGRIIFGNGDNFAFVLEGYKLVDNIFFATANGRSHSDANGNTHYPVDFGVVRYAETSDIIELYFENRTDVQIGDIAIEAKDGTLNTGVVAEFSKTLDPFDALSQLNFAGPYNPGEKQVFYMRIDSDNTADPNAGSFELEATGLNV